MSGGDTWPFRSGARDQSTVLAHELGHVLYRMKSSPGFYDESADNDSSLRLENQVRRAKDPSAAQRTRHNPIF
jgi:hypothetical protein